MAVDTGGDVAEVPAAAPAKADLEDAIEDDGAVELALLATAHPDIQRFGKLVLEHARSTNRISGRCASWLDAGSFPDEALEDYSEVQVAVSTLHKEVERLDSIDLGALEPGWGDKATVRMSRKTLIGFGELLMTRLDALQSRMAGPAAALKQERKEAVSRQRSSPQQEQSLEEKYGDRLRRPETGGEPAPGAAPSSTPGGRPARGAPELPVAKRRRQGPSQEVAADVAARLKRLQAKIGQPLEQRSVQAFRRQLTNLANLPDFAKSPQLCREGVESALGAVQAALVAQPSSKALAASLLALERIEALKDPSGLPSVLLGLSRGLEGL